MRTPRDFDTAERAFRIKAYAYGTVFGAMCFGVAFVAKGLAAGIPAFLAGTAAAGWLGARMAGAGSGIGAWLYTPSGRSTPGARQYSLADALIVRGRFFDAADELQRCAAQYPDDVEPKVRLARLYRDELQQPEDAVTWFRRALETTGVNAAREQALLRELAEVYTTRLHRPRAAAPWLARLASRHADSPHGAWAKRELAEVKRSMSDE